MRGWGVQHDGCGHAQPNADAWSANTHAIANADSCAVSVAIAFTFTFAKSFSNPESAYMESAHEFFAGATGAGASAAARIRLSTYHFQSR